MHAAARSVLAAGLAASGYGAWAYFANRHAGPIAAYLASLVQGSYSFALTLLLTGSIELLLAVIGRSPLALAAVVATATAGLFAIAFGLQWLAGTPSILITILPGWIIGTVYAVVYTINIGNRPQR